ncbi:MAG: 23S rRNA (guanosine(2251)-2'-O)-methyltransferase RlmB [Flavobacteriales bacterium]|nr:23S rRNA (guanosine(2251)-2'-O)-methyltransferase RlmB [Flavobacteriales bacterium]
MHREALQPADEEPVPASRSDVAAVLVSNIIFGVNPVLEALRSNPRAIEKISIADGALNSRVSGELMTRAKEAGVKLETTDRKRLEKLSEGAVHQGVVAQVRDFEYLGLDELISLAKKSAHPLVVLLDGIQDPHNLGAIIRSAHAFGAQGVVIMKDRAVGVTGVAVKSSAGATSHCAVSRVTNLSRAIEQLKEAGFWSVAADPDGSDVAWKAKLTGPLAVIVGAEGSGVRKGVLGHADFKVRIPMTGQVASLNARRALAGVLLTRSPGSGLNILDLPRRNE